MVASTSKLARRFVPPPPPFVAGRWRLPRFTLSDADALMRLGIIPEDATTELLDGLIVLKDRSAVGEDPAMIGKDHTKCVERFSDLRQRINSADRHVESQQPLVCSETHVPEPDFMVLKGTLDDYTDRPLAADAWCVVEVADSSYERDTGEKLAGYAEAGIAQYIVINLRNRTAETYTGPDSAAKTYLPPRIVGENELLDLRLGDVEYCSVMLVDLLP